MRRVSVVPAILLIACLTPATAVQAGQPQPAEATAEDTVAMSPRRLVHTTAEDTSTVLPLDGASVTGGIHASVDDGDGIAQVRFYVDDPSMTRPPYRVERNAPFELSDSAVFDTTTLADGAHDITAEVHGTDGSVTVLTATVTVVNEGSVPVDAPTTPTETNEGSALADASSTTTTAPAAVLPRPRQIVHTTAEDTSTVLPLDGASVTGGIHASVPDDGDIATVRFYVNDPTMQGRPHQKERFTPFELNGGAIFDTTTLADGAHHITAEVHGTAGSVTVITATVTVVNDTVTDRRVATGSPVRPDASTTGPRVPKRAMTVHDSSLTITADGTVVEGVIVNGSINVHADDVVIRDVIVRSSGYYPIRVHGGHTGTLIEHCEIAGVGKRSDAGIVGSDLTVRACNIHHLSDGLKIGSRSVYEGNWIHSPIPGRAHTDGMQMMAGSQVVIRGNRIDIPMSKGGNSAIILKTDRGPIDDVLIEGNWLNGGNYTVYSRLGHGSGTPPTNVSIIDNRFGRGHRYGVLSLHGSVDRADNVWHDTGDPI